MMYSVRKEKASHYVILSDAKNLGLNRARSHR